MIPQIIDPHSRLTSLNKSRLHQSNVHSDLVIETNSKRYLLFPYSALLNNRNEVVNLVNIENPTHAWMQNLAICRWDSERRVTISQPLNDFPEFKNKHHFCIKGFNYLGQILLEIAVSLREPMNKEFYLLTPNK